MKISYITNLRAPYRTLQLNEFSKIKDVELTTFYTDKKKENRKWNSNLPSGYNEIDLKGVKIFKKYGYINKGLIKIVKNSDLIILGCYEQPTYILLSFLCNIFNKKYILSFDGISTDRLKDKENRIKKLFKKYVINNASFIMGNGTVSKRYFNEVFNYPIDNIYNQYLTVDSKKINELYKDKEIYKKEYREKYNININEKVLLYSGRLISIKNVQSVIKVLGKLEKSDLTLLITGGGELEDQLKELAKKMNVKVIITGFISEQEELFKHYFAANALILPSIYEPWGLVVNEAMISGLPVLVSKACGCSLDLVKDNGYSIDPFDEEEIYNTIEKLLYYDNIEILGYKSREIIKEWNFKNSALNLEKILKLV